MKIWKLKTVIGILITLFAFGCGSESSAPDASHALAPAYSITWACENNCNLDTPFQYQDRLELTEDRALLHRTICGAACADAIEISFVRAEGACSMYLSSTPYSIADLTLCASDTDLTGQLKYTDANGVSRWVMTGVEVAL